MKFHAFTASFIVLTTLVSCGQDVAKNRSDRPQSRVRETPQSTADVLVSSQIHRLRGFDVLSYSQEIDLTVTNALPAAYKTVPDMLLDDEGRDGKNVITMAGMRPGVACGTGETFSGITARINDCSTKNGKSALWSGALYGAAGESTWKLVALTASGKELWQDLRTSMVWTDVLATGNWCKASGNKQTTGVNCSIVGEDASVCAGANVEGIGTNVRWRLPTRGDYLQADLDGIRFVMKSGSTTGSWTATLQAANTDRLTAWVYHFNDGTLSAQELTTDRHVRCIGSPLK